MSTRSERYRRNRKRELARQKAYDDANREKKRKSERERYRNNPEVKRKWKLNNRDKVRAHESVRAARERGAKGSFTITEIKEMIQSQGGLCAYCEQPLGEVREIDHMIPICRGGTNDWTNLAVVCPRCNRRKHAKTVEEFMRQN